MRHLVPSVLLLAAACAGDPTPETPDPPATQPSVWETYTFDAVDDDVACSGVGNTSAQIGRVFIAQTHLMTPDWPFFFLVGSRPALVQATITGDGPAPEVRLIARLDGEIVDERCLAGAASLSQSEPADPGDPTSQFEVTLPAEWVQPGLSLELIAGDSVVTWSEEALDVGFDAEVNLVLMDMDPLNYDAGEPDTVAPEGFLQDLTSALPVARTSMTRLPARFPLPIMAVGGGQQPAGTPPEVFTKKLCGWEETPDTADCVTSDTVANGDLNAQVLNIVSAIIRATGLYNTSIAFGHTGKLFPGGWGGGRTFVSGDFDDVTIHEMGHALSLPHWGDAFDTDWVEAPWAYRYPWGGEEFNGGGRGPSWTYEQHLGAKISPICQVPDDPELGLQRSDAMQRNQHCFGWRDGKMARWDGFGDFSAFAMYRWMTGANDALQGDAEDPTWGPVPYHLPAQGSWPFWREDADGERTLVYADGVDPEPWHSYAFARPQEWDVPVYTIYGTYHPDGGPSNHIYAPVAYEGTLPALLDPTDPATFADLATPFDGPYGDHFYWQHDLTFRVTYVDGSQITALYPHGATTRDWEYGQGPWRQDLTSFALNVPADQAIASIQLYERPFVSRWFDDETDGNAANEAMGITAANFMQGATLVKERVLFALPEVEGE